MTDTSSQCLIYRSSYGDLMWIDDYESLIKERDKLIKDMNESIDKLDLENIYNLSSIKLAFNKTSKTVLNDLHERGKLLIMLNTKIDTVPITPPNPGIKDLNKLREEKSYLAAKILGLEREIRENQQYVFLLSRAIGDTTLPRSDNPEIEKLMVERNMRVRMLCNCLQFQNEFAAKKKQYESQRGNFKFVYDQINMELESYQSIIEICKTSIALIDDKLDKLDQVFLWNIKQIDKDIFHLTCKRDIFLKKTESSFDRIERIKKRIVYIDSKFSEINNLIMKFNFSNSSSYNDNRVEYSRNLSSFSESINLNNNGPNFSNLNSNEYLNKNYGINEFIKSSSTGFNNLSQNSYSYSNTDSNTNSNNSDPCDLEDDSDDFVLNDLNQEIEKAIHQVEDTVRVNQIN